MNPDPGVIIFLVALQKAITFCNGLENWIPFVNDKTFWSLLLVPTSTKLNHCKVICWLNLVNPIPEWREKSFRDDG